MEHIYQAGQEKQPVLVLLHGTGGDETNLLPLAKTLNPDASVLSIRGSVNENGMLRYFKRKAEGVYDVEDLNQRSAELYTFIEEASQKYNFELEDAVFLGFSNGSNIAINMLLMEESEITKGLLFAPMYPVDVSANTKDMSNVSVYLSMGKADPIVTNDDSENVLEIFNSRGAQVETFWVNGHELTLETVQKAKEWLNQISK